MTLLRFLIFCICTSASIQNLIVVTGPGLEPEDVIMPARYFTINFTFINENTYTPDLAKLLSIDIKGKSKLKPNCRIWTNRLDRKDGTFIVRYKVYETCYDLKINIYYKNKHVDGSPYKFEGPVQPDLCDCPKDNIQSWLKRYGCLNSYPSIENDLQHFHNIDMNVDLKKIIKRYHQPESTSFCHYIVKDNNIYRDCYGKHVGFNMFSDNVLLFLTRLVKMPDMELVINLGDWPLVKKGSELLPIFSWCGSNDTMDIVMPTYDITESTLENMGRVSLDILSVQGGVERPWSQRESRAIWRGRDSRAERLKLVDIAREHPHLFNVSLTNFFFFREKEAQYGPKQPHISFFKFFDYKYQINIDGTVAAYRFPYLLAGGGLILKQDSPFYEHFYSRTEPWKHYVPVKRDLSDLIERLEWAIENDGTAQEIAKNARIFANENLLPQHIICYHAVLFYRSYLGLVPFTQVPFVCVTKMDYLIYLLEWSKRINNEIRVGKDMTHVPQPKFSCDCEQTQQRDKSHEEL